MSNSAHHRPWLLPGCCLFQWCRCCQDGQFEQAVGVALEGRRLDKLEEVVSRSSDPAATLAYALRVCQQLVINRDFRQQVLWGWPSAGGVKLGAEVTGTTAGIPGSRYCTAGSDGGDAAVAMGGVRALPTGQVAAGTAGRAVGSATRGVRIAASWDRSSGSVGLGDCRPSWASKGPFGGKQQGPMRHMHIIAQELMVGLDSNQHHKQLQRNNEH